MVLVSPPLQQEHNSAPLRAPNDALQEMR